VTTIAAGRSRYGEAGWMIDRTKRLADLIALPNILQAVEDLVEALDDYAASRGVEPRELHDDVIFAAGMNYVVHRITV
jgi:hypothetical protein